MTFDNPEVVELGPAEDLIQDEPGPDNSEGTVPSKTKIGLTAHAADAE
jgi:hypothetical protein